MRIYDFALHRAEIIQTDRYKAICERLGITYYKMDFLSSGGMWRGEYVEKLDFDQVQLLVTGHSDFPLDEQRFYLATPRLKRWFSTNVTHADPRLVGIPLGITNHTQETPVHAVIGDLDPLMACFARPKRNRNLIYLNVSPHTYPQERLAVFELFRERPFVTCEPDDKSAAGHRHFLQQIYDHQFVLCPRGNGIDTHRMWEALYLKSIPIVRRSYAMRFFEDLPILFVDDWRQALDPRFLEHTYAEFQGRDWNMEKLNLSFWEHQFRQAREALLNHAPATFAR